MMLAALLLVVLMVARQACAQFEPYAVLEQVELDYSEFNDSTISWHQLANVYGASGLKIGVKVELTWSSDYYAEVFLGDEEGNSLELDFSQDGEASVCIDYANGTIVYLHPSFTWTGMDFIVVCFDSPTWLRIEAPNGSTIWVPEEDVELSEVSRVGAAGGSADTVSSGSVIVGILEGPGTPRPASGASWKIPYQEVEAVVFGEDSLGSQVETRYLFSRSYELNDTIIIGVKTDLDFRGAYQGAYVTLGLVFSDNTVLELHFVEEDGEVYLVEPAYYRGEELYIELANGEIRIMGKNFSWRDEWTTSTTLTEVFVVGHSDVANGTMIVAVLHDPIAGLLHETWALTNSFFPLLLLVIPLAFIVGIMKQLKESVR